ncbi:hypothetical protein [Streptomyces zagrosensis]|uniref:Uncharacterized protein n=1 Tax=Streptomyces zagrosensis TaxID=1042984 RepID=A0A7W9QHV9_9ACTN|nr:hypothetical protein [Streptomyces zagrosensis]MBB5939973.1 hypothetical protein [Streptomyces zagrosensis]
MSDLLDRGPQGLVRAGRAGEFASSEGFEQSECGLGGVSYAAMQLV